MSEAPAAAFVGLGSNLDDPRRQILTAFDALARLPSTRLVARSSLYRSAPVGPPGQPDYINAVAQLATALEPLALLDRLQAIERDQRRVRGERWGPRTLDLDLLLFEGRVIESERLTLPHPEMGRRNFVLVPLAEIAPGLVMPDNRPLDWWLAQCPEAELERI